MQVVEAALSNAEMSVDEIDWLLLHQANKRILDAAAQRLKARFPLALNRILNRTLKLVLRRSFRVLSAVC
jgi:3-oxoacyl-[acyl-carrier-protein] synthase III